MPVKIQVPKRAAIVRALLSPWGRTLLIAFIVINLAALSAFTYYWVKYSKLVEQKLAAGPFTNTSMLFSAPRTITVGDEVTAADIVDQLRRSGYTDSRSNLMGWYNVRPDAIEIYPGKQSYFLQEDAVIKLGAGKVSQIISLRDNSTLSQYRLEPELITNLFDRNREKRRLVKFNDIPRVLVDATVSVEDKRFFQHSGFDPLRILKAAYVDVKKGYRAEGASTLSMQVARMFWLTPAKTFKRKASETIVTLNLEQKLSKEQIFEYYANQVDLGRRGSFAIRGFAQAAQTYFGKDLKELSLPEAATLAGLVQRPSFTNPVRWPERARQRRNVVLQLMRDNGYIDQARYQAAVRLPMIVSRGGAESTEAPYFVDLVNDWLQDQFQDHDFQSSSYRVYTSLDMDLQRDAAEAVRAGMKDIDELIRKRTKKGQPVPEAQVALVALDARTGEVKALVGGRDYGASQLNRVLAKRQPGSAFKPFVYAAALNTALQGDAEQVLTPATMIEDEPTTFYYDERPYTPSNFKHQFYGTVSMRQAIAKSLNIPTVKLAEIAGYQNVVDVAKRAGLNMDIRPTPAVALGAYEVTPLEIAGAYTMYTNSGVGVKPTWVNLIRSQRGNVIFESKLERRNVLDPRVNYLMVNLMEEVMRTGTAAGVRSRGFTLPAAGKTGTSHDGWFAGFTSRIVCVVWIGFDDNKELNLEGAKSALPIWTEFMKRAHSHREYRSVQPFVAPEGIVNVDIDPSSGQLATSNCPGVKGEYFISGTQPVELCRLHSTGATQVAGWETTAPSGQTVQVPVGAAPAVPGVRSAQSIPIPTPPEAGASTAPQPVPQDKPEKKKGFFGRIRDVFR